MPRLWLDYCQFLMDQGRVTHTRRTFDRALRALPITQHSRIWPLYLRFLRSHPLPETAVRGYRRFLKVSLLESEAGPGSGKWVCSPVQELPKLAQGDTSPMWMSPNRQYVGKGLLETGRQALVCNLFVYSPNSSSTPFTCVPSTWQDEED